ncbi:BMP family lipoprotein [Alicyclobacillus macrosporangiidus]|uniref:Basic membrane protein A n=1 Tax=Alicyclobacillus macrosporangiidus TaxID=392015 RepID=A0A1I7KWC6_9BACL|nr:BMP family ABC transporter substrate-binding protein [Alicyclobacillus macrosporangiidus]SFV01792.1 basic membrane protein A [Alicyclobacillus macrosporangiidus]
MRRMATTTTAAILLMGFVTGCGVAANKAGTTENAAGGAPKVNFKVGLVTDSGGLNDHGFNHLSDVGLEKAKQELGVSGSVVESKSESDYVPNLQRFAQQGYNLVIAVGYLMDEAVKQVAPQYPNTKFLIIDDPITDINNVTSAMFKTEQCGYLVGALAGLMEKRSDIQGLNPQNVLGVVGGQKIPPVDSYIAGFLQGVKKTDPDAQVIVKYVNSFNDQAGGSQVAQTEIAGGADIVFQVAGGSGIGVINAAKSAGVFAIGVDADQNYVAPNTVIVSALKGVDTATYDVIKDTLNNQFKPGVQDFDLANNGVGISKTTSVVPADIVNQVNDLANQIKNGSLTVSDQLPKS